MANERIVRTEMLEYIRDFNNVPRHIHKYLKEGKIIDIDDDGNPFWPQNFPDELRSEIIIKLYRECCFWNRPIGEMRVNRNSDSSPGDDYD